MSARWDRLAPPPACPEQRKLRYSALDAIESDAPMPLEDPFLHVRNRRIRNVLDVWLAAAAGRGIPPRRAIDPAALGRELEIVWICEVIWPGPRYRYRLAGEKVNDVYGVSLAGRHMDEIIPAEKRASVLARYHRVVTDCGISHTAGRLYLSSEKIYAGERIVLPLSENGDAVDAILGATDFALPTSSSGTGELKVEPAVTFTPVERILHA